MEDDSDYAVSCSASEAEEYLTSEDGDYGYDAQAEPEISTRRASVVVAVAAARYLGTGMNVSPPGCFVDAWHPAGPV